MINADEVGQWIKAWMIEHEKHPFYLEIGLNEPIKQNDVIEVVLFPHEQWRDEIKCFKQEKYKDGYEIPVFLFREELTRKTARTLETQLVVIKEFQGLEFYEGLAFMTQIFMMISDLIRNRKGINSILTVLPTWGGVTTDIPKTEQKDIILTKNPIWSINLLLDFWIDTGARFSSGIFENKFEINVVTDFMLIPPRGIPIKNLEKDEFEKARRRKYPAFIDSFTKLVLNYFPNGFNLNCE